MDPWARISLATIAVIAILLIALAAPRVRDFERFLSGFWSGEASFLRQAGLSEMHLYIAPGARSGGGWRRQGYLVLIDLAGQMVSNQGIELSWGGGLGRWASALKSSVTAADEAYKIGTVDVEYAVAAVMAGSMSLGLNCTKGTLVLYDKTKVYAFLIKDNEVSIAANKSYCEDLDTFGY